MRVLFITNYSKLYGANRSLLSLLEYFKGQGEEVCLLIPRHGGMTDELSKHGIRYMAIPYMSSYLYYKKYNSIIKTIGKPLLVFATLFVIPLILYRVRRYNPDIIYSNSCSDNYGVFLAKLLGKKHIQHVRDFMDLDHDMKFIFGNKAKKEFINKSDAVIYVSRSVAEYTQQTAPLPQNHIVIYNGVKIKSIEAYTDRCVPPIINLGIVGLLDESKGQHLAIKYFSKIINDYPKAVLHIWGDKESGYKQRLFTLIDELDIKGKVLFHGFENNTDVIYKDMSALLMCSRMEAFGRVTVEAMLRGIPVIGYDSGGTSELVKTGYNGFLFKTEEDFKNSIKSLFSSDASYNAICKNAYDDAHEHYSEIVYAKNVYDFVKNILK